MLNKKIKELREENKLSQPQVAQMLGMSRSGYASWEQGLAEPSSTDLKKLCIIFNVTADELLEIDDEKERKKIILNNLNSPNNK